ncbi:MAG TPA: alpha/beta fold hydrolase [Thermoanaerobaculia bacterium]|nr:alpha/beta fold hydrolase [Thermoanaerobaculia bacterium]
MAALAAAHCNTTDHTRRGYLRALAATYDAPPRPVIIVPGFGVTRLYDPVANRYVWGTPRATVLTHYEDDLDLPPSGHDRLIPRGFVGSRGPVNIAWQLREGLRKFGRYTPDRDLFTFAYDWRLPARENATHLGQLVERVRHGGKVDIVTHSAGAMVALTYAKLLGGADHIEHLVLVAPAQHGVVDAFRIFVRPERFIRRSFSPRMVMTWPSVAELLPENGRFLLDEQGQPVDRDLWTAAGWRDIINGTPRGLEEARRFRTELANAPLTIRPVVIAGDCVPTARRVLMRRDGTFAFYPDETALPLFEPGDGTVPVSGAGAGAMLFCDGHQGIAADPSVHRAILRALRSPSL